MLQMTRESCRAALHCRPCGPRKFENDEKSGFSGGCGCHDDKRNAQKQQRHTRAMTAPVQKTNTLTSRSHSCTQKGPVKFCTASRKCGGAGCRKMAGNGGAAGSMPTLPTPTHSILAQVAQAIWNTAKHQKPTAIAISSTFPNG